MQPEAVTTGRFAVHGWDVLRIALGLLLLTTAVLKLTGHNVSAMPAIGWFGQPWVQLAVIEWEIVLGVWLLCGWFQPGAWLAAVATFVGFASVSGWLGWHDVATCGCFGRLPASPWHAFAVDLVAALVLVVARSRVGLRDRNDLQLRRRAVAATVYLGGIGGLLVIFTGTGAVVYGSPEAAIARLRNERLTVFPRYVDFGTGEPGQVLHATIEVRNWTAQPVRLIGGTSDCSCVTTVSLPREVQPGEMTAIPVQLTVPTGRKGLFVRQAVIMTDCDNQRMLRVSLGGQVR